MTGFQIVVVMGTKYIAWNNRSKFVIVLLVIALVKNVNHSFGITISKVRIMGRAIM